MLRISGAFLLPQNTALRRRTPNITDKRRRMPQNTVSPSPTPSPSLNLILVVEEEKCLWIMWITFEAGIY
jgi:hypothetical protein